MKKLVLIAALAALAAVTVVPAHAAGGWQGSVETACTVRLDNFPNPSNTKNSQDCDNDIDGGPTAGSVPGMAIDYAAGAVNLGTSTWIAGGTSGNNIGATRTTVTFNENCGGVPSGVFPIFGTSNGNFTIAGSMSDPGQADDGQALTLLAGYQWVRTGLVATIIFHPTSSGYLDNGQTIPNGVFGLARSTGTSFSMVHSAPSGTTAQAVGLLEPQLGNGSNNCPSTGSHNWEIVTAYALGGFAG